MKKGIRRLSYLWTLLAMPLAAATARIYVTNNAGTTISVLDPATNEVVQVINDIETPESVHFSPDGNRLYVTNFADNVLYVVDRRTGQHIKEVPLSGHANDLAVTVDGKRVLVCIHDIPGGLDIIDAKSLKRLKTIRTSEGLHDIEVTRDGKYAITGGEADGKLLTVFDLQKDQIAWQLQMGGVMPLAVESGADGSTQRIFVELYGLNGFAVVDFATRVEVTRIRLPDEPRGFPRRGANSGSHGIAISPDGKTLCVNSFIANSVFFYSLPGLRLLGHVALPVLKLPGHSDLGAAPIWLTFAPDSKTVYVSDSTLRAVSAIDVNTRKEVARIPVGEVPKRISTLVLP
jgi:YVTN family beta-propeller protein